MHRFLIHLTNGTWMVLVLVGVPVVTSTQVGSIRLSAMPEFRMLTLEGLGLGLLINLMASLFAGGKRWRLYLTWAVPYAAGLVVYLLLFSHYIHFQWLKDALLWLKRTLS